MLRTLLQYGVRDAKVGMQHDVESDGKLYRNKHLFISSASRKYTLEVPGVHFSNHPSSQGGKGNTENIKKKQLWLWHGGSSANFAFRQWSDNGPR